MKTHYDVYCPEGHQVFGGAVAPAPDTEFFCHECDEDDVQDYEQEDYTLRTREVPDEKEREALRDCLTAAQLCPPMKMKALLPNSRGVSLYRSGREADDYVPLGTFLFCTDCGGTGRLMEVTSHGDHLGPCKYCQGVGYTKEKTDA